MRERERERKEAMQTLFDIYNINIEDNIPSRIISLKTNYNYCVIYSEIPFKTLLRHNLIENKILIYSYK